MKCPKCGAEVKEGLAACSVCFAPLTGEEAERQAKVAKEAAPITPKPQQEARAGRAGGKGGGAVAAVLVIILLAAIGAASWYYLIYLRSPQIAARQFMDALQKKDYDGIYRACVWSGFLGFVKSGQDVKQVFDMAARLGLDVSIDSYTIESAEVQEGTATVKATVTRGNDRDNWNIRMVKGEDGKWKCDLLGTVMSAAGGSLNLPPGGINLGR